MKTIACSLLTLFVPAAPASASWLSKTVRRNEAAIGAALLPPAAPVFVAQTVVEKSGFPNATAAASQTMNTANGAISQFKQTLATTEEKLGLLTWPVFAFTILLCLWMAGKAVNSWRRPVIKLMPAQ